METQEPTHKKRPPPKKTKTKQNNGDAVSAKILSVV